MALSGRRPPERRTVHNWSSANADKGKSFEAFVAGPAVGVECHAGARTKPCLRCYLGPDVACDGCAKGLRRDWVCYQPLYRGEDGKPVVVLFHRDMMSVCELARFHQHVRIGRGEGENDGLFMCAVLKKEKYTTTLRERHTPADISDWLPILWKLRDTITGAMLLAGATHEVSDTALSQQMPTEPAPVGMDPKLLALAKAQRRIDEEQKIADASYDKVVNRLKGNLLNGSHKVTETKSE